MKQSKKQTKIKYLQSIEDIGKIYGGNDEAGGCSCGGCCDEASAYFYTGNSVVDNDSSGGCSTLLGMIWGL